METVRESPRFNAVAGVWPVDSGQILIGGVDVTGICEHKRAKYLGRVFQDPMIGSYRKYGNSGKHGACAPQRKKAHSQVGIPQRKELFSDELKILDLGLENRLSRKSVFFRRSWQALTLLMATSQLAHSASDEHTAALDPKTAAKVLRFPTG